MQHSPIIAVRMLINILREWMENIYLHTSLHGDTNYAIQR